ncbi:MAG: class I SAM-dependent methyltransferase [Candidatus Thiodiazotropha lotti]|uniref:Class I SAM-dependent methyltransferase n=1 Tax=Candidatus Thiodiazotropha lotti TaxID=2792787 RepID=A0A9E4N126_9GAMM|nr:class I SAM-dependent methyltransferase [Candidatus Thiodiazotropha lotti]MCG7919941.1 class I SAM-dependent methyltransferase [Candidatus Thiodiazotropha lotti]MCG7932549.1 class I SAM-dependent methyltransferase [Candidatus Thiodiazotropha lotti]MCG7940516.1 class I SAM-dependent methyltransferase [Candidatus Thiodiazotropha lotti]MCG7986681.1 class I SAM-dependent methyltransferase [Candidatus Thiodiazotropha lotti]
MSANQMVLDRPEAYVTGQELDLMEQLLRFDGMRGIELGCGSAWLTKNLARRYPNARFIATEVDTIQHRKNLQESIENLEFRLEGAQQISEPDESLDAVWMLKSLHHVPTDLMAQAMEEIARVLKPGGYAYFSEPVYCGEFNALMSLIHDEKQVRQAAFAAICSLAERDDMALQQQLFLNVPGCYESWEVFESRFLKVTHTKLDLDERRYQQIRKAFSEHLGEDGAHFLKPHRIDLLRKQPG